MLAVILSRDALAVATSFSRRFFQARLNSASRLFAFNSRMRLNSPSICFHSPRSCGSNCFQPSFET